MGFQNVKGKGWRYAFQHLKKNYTGQWFPTKGAARATREDHRKRVKAEMAGENTTPLTFSALATEYLEYAQRKFQPKTWKYKRFVCKSFVKFAGNLPADQVTITVLEAYLRTRATNTNYNYHRKDLCALLVWAWRRRLIPENPCHFLETLPETRTRRPVPSPEEWDRILMAAGEHRPLLLVCYHTLGRIGEVLRLTWRDVNFEGREVTLWTRKRRSGALEPDAFPMNESLYKALWGLWQRREHPLHVFLNPKTGTAYHKRPKVMRTICKQAGVPTYGFHSIRHFVSDILHDTHKVSLKRVSQLLRHKSLRTTEIYLGKVPLDMRLTVELLDEKKTFPNMEAEHGKR